MALKNNSIKITPVNAATVPHSKSLRDEDAVELDLIQRLHLNVEALKQKQKRLAFMTGELQSVLGVKPKK